MLMRICYCCGERLEKASSENPNVCVTCAQWPAGERITAHPTRIVELVLLDADKPVPGKPSLN